jgi:hypothetical protein
MALCAHTRGKFTEGRNDPKEAKRVAPIMRDEIVRHKVKVKEHIKQRIRDNLRISAGETASKMSIDHWKKRHMNGSG